ncbi:hypothetical protein [Nigerium massiliense]|uniref:hypothetical protein n=1 Tax=Nigerium massiliense TaxID=1522317 RepID=UPI0011C80F16|nr:hypothetical protein [Nigerium massiliense]
MARLSRTVRLYSLHGRVKDDPIDYSKLFDGLASRPPASRVVALPNGLSIAVESIERREDRFYLRLLAGDPTEIPILFDEATGESRPGEIEGGQWLASATRAVVDTDPEVRVVALELRRNGIAAGAFEKVIEHLGTGAGGDLKIDLNPLPSKSFIEEIERFERIREATLVVARPNFDWNDHHDHLHGLAEESGAARAESTVTAGRNESLNKSKGLVEYITRLGRSAVSDVKNAIVRGTRKGESQETSVSLERNILSGRVEFDSSLTGREQDVAVWEQESSLIDELLPRADVIDDEHPIVRG